MAHNKMLPRVPYETLLSMSQNHEETLQLQGFNELKFLASHLKHQGSFNPCEDALWEHLDARVRSSAARSAPVGTDVAQGVVKGSTAVVLTSRGERKVIKVEVKRKIVLPKGVTV